MGEGYYHWGEGVTGSGLGRVCGGDPQPRRPQRRCKPPTEPPSVPALTPGLRGTRDRAEGTPGPPGTMVRYAQTSTEIAIVQKKPGVVVATLRSQYGQGTARVEFFASVFNLRLWVGVPALVLGWRVCTCLLYCITWVVLFCVVLSCIPQIVYYPK